MQDSVKAASLGFIKLEFRNGYVEVVSTGDIKTMKQRKEGGTSLRLKSDRVLLTSVAINEVVEVIRVADGRVHYATS